MKTLVLLLAFLLTAAPAFAGVVMDEVNYKQGDVELKGYLVYDDAIKEKRPGVLVIHEWYGLNDYAKMRGKQLAEMGYVAFVADFYGGGKTAADRDHAAKMAGEGRGTPLMRARGLAALEELKKSDRVDPEKLAAIGFCFGGTGVLDLAYGGADLDAVVSFHGGLFAPSPEEAKAIKGKVVVLHGAEDTFIKPETIAEMQKALSAAGADWEMVYYGGAVHSFSNPDAGSDKSSGSAYDENAAEGSWKYMKTTFKRVFGQK